MVNELKTEARILQTATEVFIREGYDGARMQHIADEAGINKALLHYYYGSKENLFITVFEKVFSEIMNRIFSVVEAEQTLESFIRQFFKEHMGYLLTEPRLPAFIFNEISLHPQLLTSVLKKIGSLGSKTFRDLVDKEKKSGRIPESFDALQLLLNMLSLSIFPVMIRPVIREVFQLSDKETEVLLRHRIELLPEMVLASIYKTENKNGTA